MRDASDRRTTTARIKQVALVSYGLGQPPPAADAGIPILRATNIERGRINPRSMAFAKVDDIPLDRAPLLQVGEVLVVRSGAYTGDSALVTAEWAGSAPGYDLRLTPRSVEPRYLAYQMLSTAVLDQISLASMRAAQPHLNAEDLGDVVIHLPPPRTQRAIADYLDAETARIDQVMAARRSQLSLIGERLTAETEALVLGTRRGVDDRRPSAGFGRRPSSWDETALRHLDVEVQTGPFGSQLHAEDYVDGGVPVINPVHLVDGMIAPDQSVAVSEAKAIELRRHQLEVGDVVVARRGELGRVAVVDADAAGALCGTGSLRVRIRTAPMEPDYLAMLMATPPLRAYFEAASVGSTMDNLSADTLLAAPVLIPPVGQQREVLHQVQDSKMRARGAVQAASGQVGLLLERRQALITAAVTGQIEIPGVAA